MTKYIRLFKKGMYRFCMMFLLILISSGCNVKEIETQTQTETNNQYAVRTRNDSYRWNKLYNGARH